MGIAGGGGGRGPREDWGGIHPLESSVRRPGVETAREKKLVATSPAKIGGRYDD